MLKEKAPFPEFGIRCLTGARSAKIKQHMTDLNMLEFQQFNFKGSSMSDGVIKFTKQDNSIPGGNKKALLDSTASYERLCKQLLDFEKNKYNHIDTSENISGVDIDKQIRVEVVGLESLAPAKKSDK